MRNFTDAVLSGIKFYKKGFCDICHCYKDDCIKYTEWLETLLFPNNFIKHTICRECLKEQGLEICKCGKGLIFVEQKDK